jgi:hypothetical protein
MSKRGAMKFLKSGDFIWNDPVINLNVCVQMQIQIRVQHIYLFTSITAMHITNNVHALTKWQTEIAHCACSAQLH